MKQVVFLILERYLLRLAQAVLRRHRPTIIGITGSVGKTSTKDAIAYVLEKAGLQVKKTEGNLNADLGIALTVLGVDQSPAIWEWPAALIRTHLNWLLLVTGITRFSPYFVVEMGIDRLGDMKRMLRTVHPTIGIVTWIGEGHHLEFLRDPQTIAEEKGQLLAAVPKHGLSILPAHDPQKATLRRLAQGEVVEIAELGHDAVPAIIRSVGKYLKCSSTVIEAGITSLPHSKGRLNTLTAINGATLIDDTYNSSLPAAKLALEYLGKQQAKRKIAVIADILEQGDKETEIHQAVAALAKKQADIFIGVGKRMKEVGPDQWYASPDEAAHAVAELVAEGDLILVKGSQGMRMEKVSLALLADKNEAEKYLPRQAVRWQQIPFGNP